MPTLTIRISNVPANSSEVQYQNVYDDTLNTLTVEESPGQFSQVITIDDKRRRVSEDGDFIFAFGRKLKESITISVNGINKKYEIRDKKYKKEIIRGS